MLVDSHCHLNFPDFAADLPGVLARAEGAGVGVLQVICTRMADFPAVRAVAGMGAGLYCSVGVHPCHVHEAPLVTTEELLEAAQDPKVIGLGETGLDYFHSREHIPAQQESFRRHIAAARRTGLPVIIHSRDADDDTLRILREEQAQGAFPALIHCFTGSAAFAEGCLALGVYISLSGIVTFKSARDLQAIARTLPQDRVLIETDAPYLAPMPHRGQRNEPAYVAHVCDFLAQLRGEDRAALAQATTGNFFRLFTRAAP